MAGGAPFVDYQNDKTQLREFERDRAAHNASTNNDGVSSKGHSASEQ
jgi:hypothetical protein